jgi:hypothetical protein
MISGEAATPHRSRRRTGSREDLLGDRRAADHVPPLEDEHLPPGAGKIRRGGQAVVSAADDDDVVPHRRH